MPHWYCGQQPLLGLVTPMPHATLQSLATFLIISVATNLGGTMPDVVRLASGAATAALVLASGATSAPAQTPEQFYKGRPLTMAVYSGAGSAYDIYARLLLRHLGNHIPGKPTFIV